MSGIVRQLELPITHDQVARWQSGELIQVVMPELTPDQREFLITGVTVDEWEQMLGPETPEQPDDISELDAPR